MWYSYYIFKDKPWVWTMISLEKKFANWRKIQTLPIGVGMSTTNWGVLLGTILLKKNGYIYMLENKEIHVFINKSYCQSIDPILIVGVHKRVFSCCWYQINNSEIQKGDHE